MNFKHLEMSQQLVINKTLKIDKECVKRFSRFYQDLCHDTNSEPTELDMPNLLNEIRQDDLDMLVDICQKFMVCNPKWLPAREYSGAFCAAMRFDMIEIIARIMNSTFYWTYRESFSLRKYMTDTYVMECYFQYFEPLEFACEALKKEDMKISRFISGNLDKIVAAERNYLKRKNANKHFILLEIMYDSMHCIRVLELGMIVPMPAMPETLEMIKKYPLEDIDYDYRGIELVQFLKQLYQSYTPEWPFEEIIVEVNDENVIVYNVETNKKWVECYNQGKYDQLYDRFQIFFVNCRAIPDVVHVCISDDGRVIYS